MVSREFITALLLDERPRRDLEEQAGVKSGVVRDMLAGRVRPSTTTLSISSKS